MLLMAYMRSNMSPTQSIDVCHAESAHYNHMQLGHNASSHLAHLLLYFDVHAREQYRSAWKPLTVDDQRAESDNCVSIYDCDGRNPHARSIG